MSKRAKLTKTLVAKITLSDFEGVTDQTRDKVLWDSEVQGFGLRVMKNGTKSYVFSYRLGKGRSGRMKQMRIGGSDMHPDNARKIARGWRDLVANGGDPSAKRNEVASLPSVKQLCADYIERHAIPNKRPRGVKDDQRMIDTYVIPAIGKVLVKDVTHRQIEDLHRNLSKGSPIQANRLLALLSKMFNMAMKWEWRGSNPAKGIQKNPENKRERFLSPKEISSLTSAIVDYAANNDRPQEALRSTDAIRLIVLTGARKGEVLSARWEQFDLDAGVWVKPSAHTKQKKDHRVPLSPAALSLMQEIKSRGEHPSGFVFPARAGNSGHLTEIKRAWYEIRSAAGLDDVRIHDLRHTYASILASGGMSLPIIGALLGHTQPATTARYAHLYDDPLRAATERVAAAYGHEVGEGADVIELRKAN
jgi:integrase